MTIATIKPKRVHLFNVFDDTWNTRMPLDHLVVLALLGTLVTFGITGALVLLIATLRLIFLGGRIRISRNADAAAVCYRWSLRNAIKCSSPSGVSFILSNLLGELRGLSISKAGAYKYSKGGSIYGLPDIARIESALAIVNEISDRHDDITRLAGKAGLAQALENIRNMLRSEDVYFGEEPMTINLKDQWQYFDWSEEDQRKYLSTYARNSPSPDSSVLTLGDFTSSHLCTYEEFRRSITENNISEHEIRRRYADWQEAQYKSYLRAVGVSESPTNHELTSHREANVLSYQRLDSSSNHNISLEDYLRLNPSHRYLSKEQQVAEYQKFLSQSRSSGQINPDFGEDADIW